jgi:hypothetical protein
LSPTDSLLVFPLSPSSTPLRASPQFALPLKTGSFNCRQPGEIIVAIHEGHFRARFQEFGCDLKSFEYARRTGCDDAGLPYVLETAFAWRGDRTEARRTLVPGVNWSMAIKNPFRSFGATGEGLGSYLSELRAGPQEPIIYAVHLAHPRVQYTDRGKSAITIEGASE